MFLESFIYRKIVEKTTDIIYEKTGIKKKVDIIQRKLKRTEETLKLREEETIYKIEDLGLLKIEIYNTTLKKFKENYSKIKNIQEDRDIYLSDFLNFNLEEILNLNESIENANTFLKKVNYSTQSDKSILKTIFYSPIFDAIDKTIQLANIKTNIKEAEAVIENIESKILGLQIYYDLANETIIQLKQLKPFADEYIEKMKKIIDKSKEWTNYSRKEKEIITIATALSITLNNICKTPLIEDNELSYELENHLKEADELLKKIKNIEEKYKD